MQDRQSGKTAKIWRDGALVNWEDANIHVISHVAHYGSAVFEGIRSYDTPNGGAVFRLRDHMRRLHDSCRIYRMPMAYSVDELDAGDGRDHRRERLVRVLHPADCASHG